MDEDGKYYLVPISVALNGQDETVYSIGKPQKRRAPTDAGSSSQNRGAQNGVGFSANRIAYTSGASQEEKTAIRLAYEKAIAKTSESSQYSTVNQGSTEKTDSAELRKANRYLEQKVQQLLGLIFQ